jgi:hypothetical protein
MTFKTFLIGFLLLILAPILVIGGFIGYTYWKNALPQTGLLHSSVAPQILFPGDRAEYSITFHGNLAQKPSGELKPLDMIFVVDTSSSMADTLPYMIQAAHKVAQEIVQGYAGKPRFALIQFNDNAIIEADWTFEPSILHAGLNKLVTTGLTNGLVAFPEIERLINQARPQAEKVVVFYTDGQVDDVDEMARKAELLRRRGVQLFTVITPLDGNASNMIIVMDEPTHVLMPQNVNDLTTKFRTIADKVTGIYGYGAQLLHYVDGGNFSTPLEKDSPWRVDNNAKALQLNVGYLPYRSVTYKHTLIPKSTGLWEIGLKPPQLNFLDHNNQPQTESSRQPRLLVLSWWFLILALLPAFLWLVRGINHLLKIGKMEEIQYTPPSIPSPLPPSPLPLPVPLVRQRKTVIPTLFIGIGGTGRQALYATQEALKAAHLETAKPYHFIWLDVNAHEQDEVLPLAWQAFDVDKVIAPSVVRQLEVPQGQTKPHLHWFNSRKYLDASRAALNLAHGAQGQRDLARLALFRWLQTGELLPTLKQAYQKLLAFDSIDGTRQIILFADRTGGVGSGWLVDIARLLRRLARQGQQNAQDFTPDIVGIICAYEFPDKGQQNQQALNMELETAQLTGAFPQRIAYLPDEQTLLAKTDTEAPFNWLFSITKRDSMLITRQCAELSAVLVERHPRQSIFKHLHTPLSAGYITEVHVNSLQVLPDLDLQLVKSEILLRILGKDVLLDLERDPAGKLAAPQISGKRATELLEQWIEREPKGTPWQRLLQATQGLKPDSQFLELIAEDRIPELEWFQQAFTVSLNRQLWGEWQNTGKKHWKREWMPGETIAGLRLLASRLEEEVKEQVKLADIEGKFSTILDNIVKLARSAADQLQTWLDDFAPLCEAAWEKRHALEKQRADAEARYNKQLIGLFGDNQRIVQWAEKAMQEWVSQIDTKSVEVIPALLERFFFATQLEKSDIQVTLSTYVAAQVQTQTSAKEAVVAIDNLAFHIAQSVPTLTVEGTLAQLADKQRKVLAKNMVDNQRVAEKIFVVMPTVTNRQEQAVIDAFRKAMPVGFPQPIDCVGDDHAAIRRVELQNVQLRGDILPLQNLPFIQKAEQIAEQVRKRARAKFKKELPPFPAALRIALSHPDAFRSFSNAYKAGLIVKREDETGATQWFFVEQGEFLTFGKVVDKKTPLATAAANYVYYIKNPPDTFVMSEVPGDFARLKAWQQKGGIPDEDLLVLIAMNFTNVIPS